MKKLLLLSVSFLFVLASCKKNSSSVTPNSTISATMNGGVENFNTNALGHIGGATIGTTNVYLLTIAGASGSATTADQIAINITSPTVITTGTYELNGATLTDGVPVISYSKTGGVLYVSNELGTYPTTVTITAINSSRIQGTFNGTLVLYSDAGTGTEAITNGKFNVAVE